MQVKFLWGKLVGHAMIGTVVEELDTKSNGPCLIVKVEMCESRQDVKLINQKIFIQKDRCEFGEFDHI